MTDNDRRPGWKRSFSRRTFLQSSAAAGLGGLLATNVGGLVGASAAGASVVRDENQLPGSPPSEWESYRSPSIVGFTSSFSYAPGQTVNFKVLTESTNWRVSIYRLGWYGGNRRPAPGSDRPERAATSDAAGAVGGHLNRPGRLRQLGNLGQLDRSGRCGLGHLLRPARAARRARRRQLRHLRGAPRLCLRRAGADLGDDLAGVQRLRR